MVRELDLTFGIRVSASTVGRGDTVRRIVPAYMRLQHKNGVLMHGAHAVERNGNLRQHERGDGHRESLTIVCP